METGPDVRWTGEAIDAESSVVRPIVERADAVRAVVSESDLGIGWSRWIPPTAELALLLVSERGSSEPQRLAPELGETLLRHAADRAGRSAEDLVPLLRLLAADRAHVVSARPSLDGPLPGTIEARGPDGTTVVLRWPFMVDGRSVERCHVFRGQADAHHLEPLVAELDAVLPREGVAGAPPSGAGVADDGGTRLRPYQRSAVDAWRRAGRRGILAMATGTGKTETALVAADELASDTPGLVTIVLAPFTHLVDQWVERCRSGGERAIACHSSSATWAPRANEEVDLVRAGVRHRATLVATYASAALPPFRALVRDIRPERLLLIADEAHNLGSAGSAELLWDNAGSRLGLSATPERWGDPEGDRRLADYFGGTVYEYSLGQAISDGVLAPYRYDVTGYELSPDELAAFRDASEEYARALARGRDGDPHVVEAARLRRSEALDLASGKLDVLRQRLKQQRPDRTIVYCADRGQLEAVLAVSWNEGHQAHPFTGEEPARERRRILSRFASGDIPVLGAIRCLDEGVDIPEAREAYLLRSSGNPAQYVQRRGRLLRRSPGKQEAVIHDLVAVNGPPTVTEIEEARVVEFASVASNKDEALEQARRLLRSTT